MAGPVYTLSQGETYVLSKQNNTVYIKSSTDSVESTFLIRNNLQIRTTGDTGSYNSNSIILRGIGGDTSINFQNSATTTSKNYMIGYSETHDRFSLNRGNNFTNSAPLKIFHINSGSSTFHVDNGLIVTGSASVNGTLEVTGSAKISNDAFDATSYSYIMTTAATGSVVETTWNIPSATTDRMFYVHSAEQYTGASITGGSDYLQIKTDLTGIGTIAWHETIDRPQYNHSFLIPAGIACVVTFIKGANTVASSGDYLEWQGHSIKLGG